MFTIILPRFDDFDAVELHFEHSLISISKWESMHEKPFFDSEAKTDAESASYVRQMLLTSDLPDNWETRFQSENIVALNEYINSKQTATWFSETSESRSSGEVVTNELVYYWMTAFKIPFYPTENWHFNRLMTLIRICGIKQTKPKNVSQQQQAENYRRLNAQRRAELGTSG